MNAHSEKPLLAGVPADRYVGRLDLIERLYLYAVSGAEPFGMRISSPPATGASELIRQVYDRLFTEQRYVVPFYFALRSEDGTSRAAATRYIYQFLLQTIAFRRKEPGLLSSSPDICELAKLAPLADAEWVGRLCEVCLIEGPLNDERAYVRSALAAPLRAAAAAKMRVCLMIDDLHESTSLVDGRTFTDELSAVYAHARVPFILGARRRFAIPGLYLDELELGSLSRTDAGVLIETLAFDAGVTISDQTRDLIAVQFGGNPRLIRQMIAAARDKRKSFDSYRDVEQVYSEELLNGRIAHHFERIFAHAAPDHGVRRNLLETLYFAIEPDRGRFSISAFRERLGLGAAEFGKLAESLDLDEVIEIETGSAILDRNVQLRDFLETRYRLDHERKSAASVAASTVTNALKRAPQLMSDVYRREAAAGLGDVMMKFDLQNVPRALLDYRIFRDRYKGASDNEIQQQIAADADTVPLPQISHSAPVSEHYQPFDDVIEPERTAVGVGFTDRSYRDEDQTVWLAAEIESKLEADRSVAEEWFGRLDEAAAACGFTNSRFWLVSPEGFSDGALDLISDRQGFGSSRRQVDLLRKFLAGDAEAPISGSAEFEMVIPIGEDTELIAAHSLEEITRRYNFPAKAVNQIKTALVEACINAAEHSLSPDRKIYQKFAIDNEKIVITVSNRGLRLADKNTQKPSAEIEPTEGRRGWGLKLMRGLMDEVRMESVDDGTRIVMTKHVNAPE